MGLIYGVEEMKQEEAEGVEEEEGLGQLGDKEEYELGRKLAIEIETNIHTIYKGMGEDYREKARMILVTLND